MKAAINEATKLRREIGERTGARGRLRAELRGRCARYAAMRVTEGATQKMIANELGVSVMTVQRWLRKTPTSTAVVPVRIVEAAPMPDSSSCLIVTTRGGLRVEGLGFDALCTLIARVG